MAVDAQWSDVVVMLPLSADFSDARGNVTEFAPPLTEILDTVGTPFGAGEAAYFSGEVIQAYNYSGGFVTLPALLNLSADFSIEFAFYPEDGGHGSDDAILLQIGEAAAGGAVRILCNGVSNPCQLRVQYYNGSAWADLITFVTTGISDDAWHWVKVDLSATTFSLRVDNVLISEDTYVGIPPGLGGFVIHIGQNGINEKLFKGWMSQIRITQGSVRVNAIPSDPWPRPTISGTVLDVAGLPIRRLIRVIQRAQGVHVLSDLVTGQYTAYPTTYDEQIVLRIDTDTDPPVDGVGIENCLVYDRVTPGS